MAEELAKTRKEPRKGANPSRFWAVGSSRAEQELARREEMDSLVRKYGSDLVFRMGCDGRLLELSDACENLLGACAESLQGRHLRDFVVREDKAGLARFFQKICRGPVAEGVVVRLGSGPGKPAPVLLHCRAVPHPQTQALEIVGIACSLRPGPVASRQQDLAVQLAHELNQPLCALAIATRACSLLARAADVDKDELIQAIDSLVLQAERAGALVQAMRQLAAKGTLRYSMAGADELVRSALRMLEIEVAKEQVSLDLRIPVELPKIKVDRILIEQVLVNLLRNGIEAMIDLPVRERVLTIDARLENAEMVLAIADKGRGLSPEIAERIFQAYQTTKPNGMGLGLALSEAIVQAHAGRLWVDPPRGTGAVFCFALPLS